MSTTKSRINISLPDDTKEVLIQISKRDQMPAATKARQLLELALELEEDRMLEKIASERDIKDAKYLTHAQTFGD